MIKKLKLELGQCKGNCKINNLQKRQGLFKNKSMLKAKMQGVEAKGNTSEQKQKRLIRSYRTNNKAQKKLLFSDNIKPPKKQKGHKAEDFIINVKSNLKRKKRKKNHKKRTKKYKSQVKLNKGKRPLILAKSRHILKKIRGKVKLQKSKKLHQFTKRTVIVETLDYRRRSLLEKLSAAKKQNIFRSVKRDLRGERKLLEKDWVRS